jgi:6-phosphogluconolactonase
MYEVAITAIHVFAYDSGTIGEPLQSASPNDGILFSPRHVDFHPMLPLAYVSLERQSELAVFGYGPHGFDPEPLYRVTTLLGGRSKGLQYAGTVRMHPSGRFVFITNRTLGSYEEDGKKILTKGGDDIAVFEIDQASGEPTMIQRIDAEGIMPRTMNTDPAGELLVVANQFTAEAYDGDVLRYVPQSLMIYRMAEGGQLTRAWRHELDRSQKPMIWMDVFPA